LRRALQAALTFLALCALVAATVVGVTALDRAITEGMANLKPRGIAALEQYLDRSVSYGSISPSVLRQIVIRDLAIGPPGSELLTVRTLRMRYSLLGLLATRDTVGSLKEIRLSGATLRLDLASDAELLERLSRLVSSDYPASGLPRLRLVGSGVDLRIAGPNANVTGTGLSFEAGGSGDRFGVSLRGDVAASRSSGAWLRSSLKIRGTLSRDFATADATVRILALDTPLGSLRPQTLQATWDDSRLELTKIEDRVPVDLALTMDVASGELCATMRAEGFRADQLAHPAGDLRRYESWFTAPLSGSARLAWRPSDGSLSYSGDLAAELVDQLPAVPDLRVAAAFDGDRRRVSFHDLVAASPRGSLQFVGDVLLANLWPDGVFTVWTPAGLEPGLVGSTLTVRRVEAGLSVEGTRVQLGLVGFDRLKADLAPRPAGLKFDVAVAFTDAPQGNQTRVAGELVTGAARSLSLSASLVNAPPDLIYHLALGAGRLPRQEDQVRDLLSALSVNATVAFWTDFDHLVVTSPQLTVGSRTDPGTRLSTVFTMDQNNLYLSGFTGTWRGLTLAGDASVKIADDGTATFGADARFKDIPYAVAGSWSPRDGLLVEGSYGLSLALVTGSDGSASLRARATRLPIPTTGRVWYPTFEATGEADRSGDWRLAGRLAIDDLGIVPSAASSLDVAFDADPRRVSLDRIRYADGVSVLDGGGTIAFRTPLDPVRTDLVESLEATCDVELRAAGAAESYSLHGTATAGKLDARVDFTSSPLSRLGTLAIRGAVSGSARVAGPLESPEVSASISLVNGMLASDPIAISSGIRLAGRRLEIRGLAASYLDHRISGISGDLDLGAGTVELVGDYSGLYFRDRVQLLVALRAAVGAASRGASDAGPFGMRLDGRIDLSAVRVNGTAFPSWGVRLRTADGRLYLDGGPGDSLHGSVDDRLAWVMLVQDPMPVTGRVEGRFTDTRLEAVADVASFDLRIINALLKTDIVTFTSGDAAGRFAVAGPFNDPECSGTLQLVDGGLRFRYSPDAVGPLSTPFVFSGHTFSAGPVEVPVGKGWGSASIVFTMDHWEPVSFVLDAATIRDSLVRASAKFGRVLIDGQAAARVRVAADERRTDVTGTVTMHEARITLGEWVEEPFVPEEPPTFVSLQVATGKRVEFFWPSESFPVVRTVASPGGRLGVTYRGDTGAYTVTGSAGVHGGEIFFFDRSFVVKEGSITFNEDQRTFDPRITARAETREWDPELGEEVRIWLDVDDRLNEFSPRFSSDPSLPEPELFALLGAQFTGQREGQGLLSSAVMLSGDVLSRFGLLRPFEQRVRELLGLDMFSVRTQVIQNIVAEKVLGLESTNPLDNTSLSLGKYLGDDLFLEMLVRLQAPRGPTGLLLPGHGLSSEFELTLEWDTPFFLLEWSFLPRTPDTLFLTDNSLALRWRYTY